ncbi:MAG: M3 family metallopeptidase [Duodenibacillus sp.]|nr:M3 family metallopeptidase [Duodenibacillus sp.]
MNPLLQQSKLLDFASIRPEHVTPALRELLENARNAVSLATAPGTPATWLDVVEPLDQALTRLSLAWGAVGHLMGVMDSEELRKAHDENLEPMTQFYLELSQNEALFAKYKAMAADAGFADLDAVRRRVIEHEIRDFRLSGADLPKAEKMRVQAIAQEQAQLCNRFGLNVLDATNAFTLDITDKAELDGIPEDVLGLYAQQARAAGVEGWRLTLQMPSYLPAMQYASNRALREKLYRAYSTRASEFGPAEKDNTPVIARLLELRHEEAQLLGFHNFAELSLATKMASSPAQVDAFLSDMAAKARPKAERDWQELVAFAREHLGMEALEPWDIAWASEKLKTYAYAFSENEVKQYFTLPTVFSGMFALVEKLFGIRIESDTASVWHPDVQFWKIVDDKGTTVAQFYTDLYARASKRGGAWMDNDSTRKRLADGSIRTPIAYLVCNFSHPVDGKPALLTHDDVITLFHEFGHGLHHMLTRVDVSQLSGINGVEWDAVEMPSQFMENWVWNYDTVRTLTHHVDTGEELPRALFDKMLAAKNFQSGMFCERQMEFALFDMRIHADTATSHADDFASVLADVRKEVAVVPVADFNRFAQSFSHIFAGGYAAGYYSYKWAEVLSADAFAAFEEEGLMNPTTGKRWVDEVLSRGGSRDALDNFKAFRGREPSADALLRHSGIA